MLPGFGVVSLLLLLAGSVAQTDGYEEGEDAAEDGAWEEACYYRFAWEGGA